MSLSTCIEGIAAYQEYGYKLEGCFALTGTRGFNDFNGVVISFLVWNIFVLSTTFEDVGEDGWKRLA